jgi:hypothetical protein
LFYQFSSFSFLLSISMTCIGWYWCLYAANNEKDFSLACQSFQLWLAKNKWAVQDQILKANWKMLNWDSKINMKEFFALTQDCPYYKLSKFKYISYVSLSSPLNKSYTIWQSIYLVNANILYLLKGNNKYILPIKNILLTILCLAKTQEKSDHKGPY